MNNVTSYLRIHRIMHLMPVILQNFEKSRNEIDNVTILNILNILQHVDFSTDLNFYVTL
jgi:hypothetical protein